MALNAEQFAKLKQLHSELKATSVPVTVEEGSTTPAVQPMVTGDTGLKGIATGTAKGLLESAIGTSRLLQTAGQGIIAAVDPTRDFAQVQKDTGFKSLQGESAKQIDEILKGKTPSEKAGRVLAFGAEILNPLGKTEEAAALVNKGKKVVTGIKEASAAKKAMKATDTAIEAITPKTKDLTPTEYEKLLSQKRITPKTAKQPSQYVLSDAEKQTAIKYKDILQSKDPVKNSINVMEKIASQDEEVGKFLRSNNSIFNSGELKNHILEKLSDISDVTVDPARIENLKTTMINNFVGTLKKNDMESLWNARKEFDQAIEKAFSGSPSLQNTIKKEFRNAVQDFIADRTPEGVYKGYMKDMRNLFNLQETIATKASKEKGINAIQLWIKNNPNKAKALGWGAGLIGAQQVYEVLK